MLDNMNTMEIIKLFLPLIIIQYGLAAFCVVKILRQGVANLNKWAWILIVLFVNLIGSILFLAIGRRKDV